MTGSRDLHNPDPRDVRRRAGAAIDHLRGQGPLHLLHRAAGHARLALQLRRYDWNLRRWTKRLDEVPIDRPVFVLGVQGGGGTILARTLYRHPQVVYASGNCRYWAGEDEIHNCPHTERDLPEPLIHRTAHMYNVNETVEDHPIFGYQRSWTYATDELLPRYRKTAADATPEMAAELQRVIRKIVLAYAPDPDRARFVDMSQLFTILVPFLLELLEGFEPHFVLLTRNPYVTCWRAAQKEYEGFGVPRPLDETRRIRYAVEHWDNSYRLALEDCRNRPLLHVRYEDFLADPAAEIRRICEFAGLEFHESQVPGPGQPMPLGSVSPEKWYPLRVNENRRYFDRLGPELVRCVNERSADLVDRLGYDRIE